MLKVLTALAFTFLLAATSAQAQQPSRLDDILKRGTLRVGMTGDYLPFTSLDKDSQKFRGFDVDIAEALGEAMGVKGEVVQTAWPGIARCADKGKYDPLAEIDKAGTHVIVNPGGPNERFAKANIHTAEIKVYPDNVTIFDQIAKGDADVMMTDASETRYQQKLHPGVLCAVHPDKPFDFAEKAYFMQRDVALQEFVDQWLHIARENGSFKKIYSAWFE